MRTYLDALLELRFERLLPIGKKKCKTFASGYTLTAHAAPFEPGTTATLKSYVTPRPRGLGIGEVQTEEDGKRPVVGLVA